MTQPRQRLAHTPRLDAWRESLRAATEGRGAKTELARLMAAERDQPVQTWQNRINRILKSEVIPNAEDVLAITAWLASRTAPDHPHISRTGQAPPRPGHVLT